MQLGVAIAVDWSRIKAQIQRNAFLRASYLTALTAAYWMLVSDDDQYKEASDYVKDNNWLIPNPFGTQPIKIPIPFEIGLLIFLTIFPSWSVMVNIR